MNDGADNTYESTAHNRSGHIMFKKLRLRTQLNIGFALVITLLVIVSGTAYWGLQASFKGFGEYRAIGRNSLQVAEFEERLLNARLAIQKYINQENSDYAKQYQDFSTEMQDRKSVV